MSTVPVKKSSTAVGVKKVIKETTPVVLSPTEKVAIYSTQNTYWEEVGRISKGFNIVTREKSESWLTLEGIRLVTPEEVAEGYGL